MALVPNRFQLMKHFLGLVGRIDSRGDASQTHAGIVTNNILEAIGKQQTDDIALFETEFVKACGNTIDEIVQFPVGHPGILEPDRHFIGIFLCCFP